MKLCPPVGHLPKVKRRLAMLVVWPLAWLEANVNFWIDAYRCWFREHFLGQ